MSEIRTEDRLGRLEQDVGEIKATLARLEPMIIRIDERLNTTFPHLATKADLAEKPSHAYLWGVMAAMVGAQAVALGAAALIFTMIQARPAHGEPFDWDRYHARQDACTEKDRIAADCVQGLDYCDELALRQAKRACSPFGPLRERTSGLP
jgi:hypothetical protein